MNSSYSTDIAILGGGVAGLWLLNRLTAEGYQAILLECDRLGGGQSVHSQGIIHGGLKYALNGSLSGAARAIADMPRRWRDCIEGNGELDLSACRVLSPHYYLWSGAGLRARMKSFLGSKAIAGKAISARPGEIPEILRGRGAVYRLPDFVVDAPSLIESLAAPHQDRIHAISAQALEFNRVAAGRELNLRLGERHVTLRAQRYILCAGEGNEQLIAQAGLNFPRCQLRPLKMVSVSGPSLPALFAHWLDESWGANPGLTITSHRGGNGETVWYLGGELAEGGVARSNEEQIETAGRLLKRLFPMLNFHELLWRCLDINRAEPAVAQGRRPDNAVVTSEDDVIVAWPTKLTLAPVLADMVLQRLGKDGVVPGKNPALAGLPGPPPLARPFWN